MFRPPRHRGAERRRSGSAGPCSFGRRQPRHVARDGRRALSQRLMGFGLLSRRILFLARTSRARSWRSVRRSRASRSVTRSSGIAKGPFAEYAAARENKLTHKPESLAFEQAAVIGSLRAYRSSGPRHRRRRGRMESARCGCLGRVGTYAVQIAVALGATLAGAASASKRDLVASPGQNTSSTTPVWTSPTGRARPSQRSNRPAAPAANPPVELLRWGPRLA